MHCENNFKRMKRQGADLEKIFASHVFDKELVKKIYNGAQNSTIKTIKQSN